MRSLHTTAPAGISHPYSVETFHGPYKSRSAAVRAMRRMTDRTYEVRFPGVSRRYVTTAEVTEGMMRVMERSGGWAVHVSIRRVHLNVRITEPDGRERALPLDIYEAQKERAAEAARARAAETAKAFTAWAVGEAAYARP